MLKKEKILIGSFCIFFSEQHSICKKMIKQNRNARLFFRSTVRVALFLMKNFLLLLISLKVFQLDAEV